MIRVPQRSEISQEHLAKYLSITERALDRLKIAVPERSHLRKLAEDFLLMAKSYHRDARSFSDDGDRVNAFACINYAHGWLDCGARMGLFDVGEEDQLFTLSE